MKLTLATAISAQLLSGAVIAQTQTQQQPTQPAECDPHYEGACIPVYETRADDVDCGEIEDRNFAVVTIGEDPHRLDRDKDGVACEER
ncbi:calcium-binding protein with excalibur domain protein [Leptolyngbyaceae cyanobacterium CCMR0082]|uniref:Calcium-binding protein with excalibur domain protein n=2 Tax=Adonisia TaxID=2950183 RepID=A0A6M0S0L5_9CYAN|nr:excalibur calcium-binding domain-containing protein [Adonisia turfae]NEZ61985.1 calcium-binding protein with excalibur domain protein [Adonisia turfae CCMR0082]